MRLPTTSKISRRLGVPFGFKPERDASPKSAMVRRPYPPGEHGKSRRRSPSDYGGELAEKQKLRFTYGLTDRALRRYVSMAAGRDRALTRAQTLMGLLERRLDNVVYRLGLAPTRRMARTLASHGHFLVNDRPSRLPGMLLRPGDRIALKKSSRDKLPFHGLEVSLKRKEPPAWLTLDTEVGGGSVLRLPSEEEAAVSYNLSKVITYYSR